MQRLPPRARPATFPPFCWVSHFPSPPQVLLLPPPLLLIHEDVHSSPRQHPAYLCIQSGSGSGPLLICSLDSLRKTHAPARCASLAIELLSVEISEA